MSYANLQVSISAPGRWHAFDLAKGLEAADALHRLITIYPKSFTQKWDIPDSKVRTLPFLIYTQRGAQRYLQVVSASMLIAWFSAISPFSQFVLWERQKLCMLCQYLLVVFLRRQSRGEYSAYLNTVPHTYLNNIRF